MSQSKTLPKTRAQPQSVVPSGLKWSLKAAENHLEKYTFIRVHADENKPTTTRILSGAPRSWKKDDLNESSAVFSLEYRITGTPENIAAALRLSEDPFGEEQIAEILANCISKDNYQTTKKEEFLAETKACKNKKDEKLPVVHYSTEQLLWFGSPDTMKNMRVEKKKGGSSSTNTSLVKSRVSPGGDLTERAGKVNREVSLLDVSTMDEKFKGVLTRPIPKTNISGKVYSENLPFLTNDYDKFYRAVHHVYGDEGIIKYADDLEEVKTKLAKRTSKLKGTVPPPIKTSEKAATKPPVKVAVKPSVKIATSTVSKPPTLAVKSGATSPKAKVGVIGGLPKGNLLPMK